jgi:hypothetical protein
MTNTDWKEATAPRPTITPPKKPLRRVVVEESADGQWYYVAKAHNGEVVYTSEMFKRRHYAVKAARREHEGRTNFSYVLEHEDPKLGIVKETL